MAKPNQTATDYIVMALSPALIMALVGSLCFFLMDVRFQGVLDGSLSWVMFWFVLGIVLISRISIEEGWERASVFVLALGATLWLYLLQNSPAYLLGVVLMTLVWYCANKLVWDCTLIDDDEDSSGEGLLQKKFTFKFWEKKRPDVSARSAKPLTPNSKADPKRKRKAPRRSSESPGRSVF